SPRFDNGTFANDGPPREVSFEINSTARSARFLSEITDPTVPYAFCCGSARVGDSGNVLIGWCYSRTVGEYKPDGSPCLPAALGVRVQLPRGANPHRDTCHRGHPRRNGCDAPTSHSSGGAGRARKVPVVKAL